MNPILDIIAAATPAETITPGVTPIVGKLAGDGLFAEVFAGAMSGVSGPLVIPNNILSLISSTDGETPSIEAGKVAELTDGQTQSALGVVVPAILDEDTGSPIEIPVVTEISNRPESETAPIQTNVKPAQLNSQILTLVDNQANAFVENHVLGSNLQKVLEGELSANTQTHMPAIGIQAQVEIPLEVASVLSNQPAVDATAQGTGPAVADKTSVSVNSGQGTTTLKAQLRKAFPMTKIESASGKVNIQVKQSAAQVEAKAVVETQVSIQGSPKANDLPIAVGHQIAHSIVASARGKKPLLSKSGSQVTMQTKAEVTSESITEDRIMRNAPRSAMRKPVLQALKSQGFDFEKLVTTIDKTDQATNGSTSTDKIATAVDKQVSIVANASSELTGIERFKLDIKRGHIETLLKKGEIKLQLQPDHLGSLKIRLITNPTEVTARLEISSDDARRSVEASLPQLRESFERAGLRLNSIEVVVSNDNDSRRQQASHQESQSRNTLARRLASELKQDVPVVAEIAQNQLSRYGGALNLVA